jgi:hypothetical protein
MRITTKIVIDMNTGSILEHNWFDYEGPLDLLDRVAQADAKTALTQADQTAGNYAGVAGGQNAALTPFLTRQMTNPIGESQKDQGAQLTNAMAGAGGATAGLAGAASKFGSTGRNPMGFSSALDAASREKAQAFAKAGSQVATDNTKVKLGQSADAAKEMGSLYGTNVDAQLKAQGLQTGDVNALTDAGKSGWLQNMNDTMAAAGTAMSGFGTMIHGPAKS